MSDKDDYFFYSSPDGAIEDWSHKLMKLEPCPFCGEPPIASTDAAIVSCRSKNCEVRPGVSRITPSAAILAWNKRPSRA